MEKAWYVWNPNHGPARHRHPSLDAAKREAGRLAIQHPEGEFIVLESICTVRACTVEIIEHEQSLPF